jgi:alkylhydroperoxidase family enzyme
VIIPYIKTIPPADATGKLKEIYQSGAGPSAARGKVSMIRQVQSLNPEILAAWRALDVGIMHGESRITRRQPEMIATVVSGRNQCSY